MFIAATLTVLYAVILHFLGPNAIALALPMVAGGGAFLILMLKNEYWIMRRVRQHGSMYDSSYRQVRLSLRHSNLYRELDVKKRSRHLYPHLFRYATTLEAIRWTGLGLLLVGLYWSAYAK
ncbi:MAG: hypothetical protein DI582_01555 [Azospirillum brasilense]|nr:MAG: hypothetical protein DI582_01555 [Azospirillum brasilense]